MATRLIGTDSANPRLPAVVIAATQGSTHDDLAPGDIMVDAAAYADAAADAALNAANVYTDAQLATAVIDPAEIAFADNAETIAGTRDDCAVSPAGLAAALDATPAMAAGVQLGEGAASNVQLKHATGTKGKRFSFQTSTNVAGTNSVELELVPDANCDPAAGIASEILMFNRTGINYERAGLAWSGNECILFIGYNGAGANRTFYIQTGGSSGLGIPAQTAIAVRADGSVDLQGGNFTITTPIISAGTTVASVVAGASCVLSAPAAPSPEWPTGSQATQTIVVNGRTVNGCTLQSGSTTVLGNFLAGDVGTPITSVATFGANRTRIADMTDTGKTRLILDTRTKTPASNVSDQTMLELRRGGVRKWFAGNNVTAGNVDAFEFTTATSGVALRLTQAGGMYTAGEIEVDGALNHDGTTIGFYGATPVTKPTVTGAKGGNAALASLLTALVNLGLITDTTTA